MATTVEVGNIQARIVATTGRFESAIRRVNSRLGSVKTSTKSLQVRIRDLNKSFDDLHKRLEKVAQTGGKMQKAFAAGFAGLVGAGGVLVKLASDANETRNKFRESFGDMTEETLRWVEETAAAYGRSRVQIQQYAADLQAVLAPTLENRELAAEMSKALTTLAFDLASFHNVAERETLERLRSGLLGSTEAVDQLGINLRQTALEQEMLRLGWRKSWAQLTEQEKILLRFNVILRATQDAQGDVIRNSREFANASRALTSALQDAGDRLGQRFLPPVTELTLRATQIVQAFNRLDDTQIDLIARFGALTAATMAAGFAFSTFLVILPQFVKGLQIVMGVMSVFASPWVLSITAIVAAAILFKKAWDQNLGGVQDKTESVTNSVIRAWENVETKIQSLNLDIPVPEWDKTIDAAVANVEQAWDEAKATIEALPPITLPEVEWPTIDTEPLKAEWERVRQEIASLEAPPIPAGVEVWIDRVTDSLKRSPGGQVVLNIGELAREVRAGEKSLGEAVREAIESNIAIPLGAAAISLLPISGGWKLALAGVALALSFIPGVNLEGLSGLVSEVWKQIVAAFQRTADVAGGRIAEVSDPILETVKQTFETLGRALGAAVAETLIFLFKAVTLAPEFVSAAVEIGRFVAENFVGPFIRGFGEEFTKRLVDRLPQEIKDAWRAVKNFISGRDELMIQVLSDPAAAAREFREATQDRQFQLRAPLSFRERLLGDLRAFFRILSTGTSEYQRGTPWTGWGPPNEIAGVVHRQEAVIPADVLRKGPGAVLEFLGAPGFQEGKLGVPLGVFSVQSQAGELKRQNEEALGELQKIGGLLSGLSERWDEVNTKLAEMAEDTPILRDLAELVRILIELARASGAPAEMPDLTTPQAVAPQTLRDRIAAMVGQGLEWLREQGKAAGESLRMFGGQILQAFTIVGLVTMLLEQLSEPVQALLVPITMVVAALATGLLPVFKATFPIVKTFGVLLLTVLQGVATVWNAIVGTLGNIFKSLANIKILGMRPFKFLEGTAKFFLGLQVDTKALSDAQKELRDLTWEEAMERAKNIDAIKKTTEALRNVPSGFKVALARFQAATPVQSFASGGYVPPTPGGRIVRVAEGGEGEYIVPESKMGRSLVVNVTIDGDVYGVDDLDRRITTAVGRAMRQARMATYGVT